MRDKKPSDFASFASESAAERAMRDAASGKHSGLIHGEARGLSAQYATDKAIRNATARVTGIGDHSATAQFAKEIEEFMRPAALKATDQYFRKIDETLRLARSDHAFHSAALTSRVAADQVDSVQNALKQLNSGVVNQASRGVSRSSALDELIREQDLVRRFSAVTNAAQWAGRISKPTVFEQALGASAFNSNKLEINRMAADARAIASDTALGSLIAQHKRSASSLPAALALTSQKLSVIAGASMLSGYESAVAQAARDALMGRWATTPELSQRYWDDPLVRARAYRQAEVDEGLTEADPETALAVLVESGTVFGAPDDQERQSAMIDVGGVFASISVRDPMTSAYMILNMLERQLRQFITDTLEHVAGPNWFKQRVPGSVNTEAKARCQTAVANGEQPLALIHYTDLGSLLDIVVNRKNWGDVFEVVFVHPEDFRVDMRRLIAFRNPTAHHRPLDAVQIVELIIYSKRLSDRMTNWNKPLIGMGGDDLEDEPESPTT